MDEQQHAAVFFLRAMAPVVYAAGLWDSPVVAAASSLDAIDRMLLVSSRGVAIQRPADERRFQPSSRCISGCITWLRRLLPGCWAPRPLGWIYRSRRALPRPWGFECTRGFTTRPLGRPRHASIPCAVP